MPERVTSAEVPDADVGRALRDTAERFEASVDDLARRLADHLMREVPELGDEPELRAEWLESNRANIAAWLEMVKRGVASDEVRPPADALEVARTYVLRGAPLAALLRVYRLGHAFVYEAWLQALRDRGGPPEFFEALVRRSLAVSFAYVDAMSAHVAEAYASARADAVRSADLVRADTARAILAGEPTDVDAAGRDLGYELRRWHVAIVLWAEPAHDGDGPVVRLEAAAREIAATLGCPRPLIIPAGRSLVWAWAGIAAAPGDDEPAGLARRPDGVSAAFGQAGEGLLGFARSHGEAVEARRVCLLTQRSAGSMTRYRDVDLLSLLTGDVPRARRFVEDELGALAAGDDTTLRLRATLKAYLEEDHSFAAAARRLGVHENTVKYRVRQCEELLGRRVGERSLKLQAALALAGPLGRDD